LFCSVVFGWMAFCWEAFCCVVFCCVVLGCCACVCAMPVAAATATASNRRMNVDPVMSYSPTRQPPQHTPQSTDLLARTRGKTVLGGRRAVFRCGGRSAPLTVGRRQNQRPEHLVFRARGTDRGDAHVGRAREQHVLAVRRGIAPARERLGERM